MDDTSDRPTQEGLDPEAAPPLPEPPPSRDLSNRRRAIAIGITVGVIATLAIPGTIGYFLAPAEPEVPFELPFEEDFVSDSPRFTTDSDPFADFSVVDGTYHILIKDSSAPQTARHIFLHTYDGLRFAATVTLPGSSALLSVGCWASNHAYLFVLLNDGEVGLVEIVNESTGERRVLSDLLTTDALRPADEPNRIRIDCVGGGHDPTIVSGWINGQPVVSVAVPDGYDSFNAVGFLFGAESDGAEFVVDDVSAAAERPAPAMSPVPPIAELPASTASPPPTSPPPTSPPQPMEGGTTKCQGQVATIAGTSNPEEIAGTYRPDVIVGLGGDDVIRARDGSDIVCGGGGDDTVYADWGADRVDGNAGNDTLNGYYGDDTLDGGAGSDSLSGGGGTDSCIQGEHVSRCEA